MKVNRTKNSRDEPSKIQVKGGKIIGSKEGEKSEKDIWISEKKIIGIGNKNEIPFDFAPDLVIDARDKIVCQGFVDCSARVKEPGFEYNEKIGSQLRAAVAGGITRIVCPPDINFLLDESGAIEMLIHKARNLEKTLIHPLGALTKGLSGKKITEMVALSEAGCIGFTQANFPITDTQVLLRALQYAGGFNFAVWLNPVDPWLGANGVAHSGSVATRLGLSGIPIQSETISIFTTLELMRNIDVKVHFCRVSSERGVQLIRQAKDEGLKVTADVGVHHLHLTHLDIGDFDSNSKVIPPFRTERDRQALSQGLLDGTIDCICSDHTPVNQEAKNLPFADAEPGLMGLELLLPLTLKWGLENKIKLEKALSFITSEPARVVGLCGVGIEVGNNADICIFDELESWTVDSSNLVGQSQNSPFYGYEVQGRVQTTIVDGLCTFRKKEDR